MIGCERLQARKKKFLILNFSLFFPEIIQLVYIHLNALGKNTESGKGCHGSKSLPKRKLILVTQFCWGKHFYNLFSKDRAHIVKLMRWSRT